MPYHCIAIDQKCFIMYSEVMENTQQNFQTTEYVCLIKKNIGRIRTAANYNENQTGRPDQIHGGLWFSPRRQLDDVYVSDWHAFMSNGYAPKHLVAKDNTTNVFSIKFRGDVKFVNLSEIGQIVPEQDKKKIILRMDTVEDLLAFNNLTDITKEQYQTEHPDKFVWKVGYDENVSNESERRRKAFWQDVINNYGGFEATENARNLRYDDSWCKSDDSHHANDFTHHLSVPTLIIFSPEVAEGILNNRQVINFHSHAMKTLKDKLLSNTDLCKKYNITQVDPEAEDTKTISDGDYQNVPFDNFTTLAMERTIKQIFSVAPNKQEVKGLANASAAVIKLAEYLRGLGIDLFNTNKIQFFDRKTSELVLTDKTRIPLDVVEILKIQTNENQKGKGNE